MVSEVAELIFNVFTLTQLGHLKGVREKTQKYNNQQVQYGYHLSGFEDR